MRVMQLAKELLASGWPSRKMAILGARYYLGIETKDELFVSLRCDFQAYDFILKMR